MILKKKQILTATLALALGAAIFVNWYYSKPQTQSTLDSAGTSQEQKEADLGDAQYVSATTAADVKTLADFKLKRDAAHDKAKETYNSVIKDSASSSAAVDKSTQELSELAKDIKSEADLENLITAKISSDCVVIIDGDVCQVIVGKGKLNENASLQIKDLVIKQTKIAPNNITIVELK